jgi:hypothetical protein
MKSTTKTAKSQVKWCFALGYSSPATEWKAANQSFTQNSSLL